VSGRALRLMTEFIATVLVFLSATQYLPITARGVQCPLAPVQTIAACCNGRMLMRTPRPGEKGFVQCSCAERNRAKADAAIAGRIDLWSESKGLGSLSLALHEPVEMTDRRNTARSIFQAPPEPPPPSL